MSGIGELIERHLRAKKWSGYRLARAANVSDSTISRIRSGEIRGEKAATIIKIADALGASRVEFLRAAGHQELVFSGTEDDLLRGAAAQFQVEEAHGQGGKGFVEEVKSELAEIKSLLRRLLEKSDPQAS